MDLQWLCEHVGKEQVERAGLVYEEDEEEEKGRVKAEVTRIEQENLLNNACINENNDISQFLSQLLFQIHKHRLHSSQCKVSSLKSRV